MKEDFDEIEADFEEVEMEDEKELKMKSDLYETQVSNFYKYRSIQFEIKEGNIIDNYFCAYFYLWPSDIKLGLHIENPEHRYSFGSVDFLNSKVIGEIGKSVHKEITYAEWRPRISILEAPLLKIGVDYNHYGDVMRDHTLESVCRDCEKVIDKIHDMGIFKGD